jgi:hypothetical protein
VTTRREVITLLGSTAVTWPLVASAQQAAVPVIGILHPGSSEAAAKYVASLRKGLLQRFDFEWTASRISRNSFGPFRRRRFRRCRSSSGADGSRSLSNCEEAKPRAFDLAFWVRDLAGCATVSACSRRRRIASGRDNRASWRPIQASKAASWAGCKRTRIGSPLPVAGGPRFLGGVSD